MKILQSLNSQADKLNFEIYGKKQDGQAIVSVWVSMYQ